MNAFIFPEAEAEVQAAAQWYQNREAGLGEQFLDELVDVLFDIEKHPQRGPYLPHAKSTREFRRRSLSRFPYHVIYEVGKEQIRIVAVAHAHRRPNYWNDRL